MNGRTRLFIKNSVIVLMLMMLASIALPVYAFDCEGLAKLQFPHTTITMAEAVAAGTLEPSKGMPIRDLPAFCRVAATLKPSSDSSIRVEVWLPQTGWNGRIKGTGNGGLAGTIAYPSLASGLRRGYAVANTDMGMAVLPAENAGIFIDRPERWADWGYRSTHEMTVLTKQLVKAYYGQDAKRSYFVGCSTGGEQALMEAQRFPDDYDGIVGGAAANNRTGVHVSILWNFVVTQRAPASYLSSAKLAMLSKAVLNACDALDGVKDGLIVDPPKCNFDPTALRCKAGDQEDCLTAAQVETVEAIYAGPKDPRTGESLYPGLAKGGESGWGRLFASPGSAHTAPYTPIFEWAFGVNWNWHAFDFDHDVVTFQGRLASAVNATNPDLDPFREHGHKLLMYHGWNDSVVAPGEAIKYYQAVVTRDKEQSSKDKHKKDVASQSAPIPVDSFYRLFMVPGMEHCGGGPGPGDFNALDAVVKWVEQGIAPDRLIVTQAVSAGDDHKQIQERLLCPYPSVAQYRGDGDINDASSYRCAAGVSPRLRP
ncbi:MAG: tannase/feruloyl esterase family alpha/beta hydrolase [Acidobacteriaceae bacterium]|nr:tannase/feruloyl esterase family alpha/beta hydrolase [Acidobacteriaceae bacterium]